MTKKLLLPVTLAFILGLTACGQQSNDAKEVVETVTETVTEAANDAGEAVETVTETVTETVADAVEETTEVVEETVAESNLPEECTAYLDTYRACVKKVSDASPEVAKQLEEGLAQTEKAWAEVPKEALVEMCKQASETWESVKASQGC